MPEVRQIDANALKDTISNIKLRVKNPEMMSGLVEMQVAVLREVEAAPTISPEVRHGRWKGWTTSRFTGKYKDYDEPEFKDYVYYTCSECYRKSAIQELYCPQCGARMDADHIADASKKVEIESTGCWMSCEMCANTGCSKRNTESWECQGNIGG